MDQDSRTDKTVTSLASPARRPLRGPEKKQKWESLKDDVKRIYILENKTLQETIKEIEGKHSFKARYAFNNIMAADVLPPRSQFLLHQLPLNLG